MENRRGVRRVLIRVSARREASTLPAFASEYETSNIFARAQHDATRKQNDYRLSRVRFDYRFREPWYLLFFPSAALLARLDVVFRDPSRSTRRESFFERRVLSRIPAPPFQCDFEPPCPILNPHDSHGADAENRCSREHCPQIIRSAHTLSPAAAQSEPA